ncbi:MAG TPA: recombinase family protein [Geminicoccaceae bacterium]
MPSYIAYLRVSTQRQGASGLGLEAQQAAVERHVAGRGDLLRTFTEVESGRRDDRPELLAALAACRRAKAVLVIAKLDRLARSVALISRLMESGVEFVACDMPEANRFVLHVLAAVAEHERAMISERTRAALAAARARGVRLGARPGTATTAATAGRRRLAAAWLETVRPELEREAGEGASLRRIAAALNRRGIGTRTGKEWGPGQVRRALLALAVARRQMQGFKPA